MFPGVTKYKVIVSKEIQSTNTLNFSKNQKADFDRVMSKVREEVPSEYDVGLKKKVINYFIYFITNQMLY